MGQTLLLAEDLPQSLARVQGLSSRLREVVQEAQAFATQQKADAERTKRTFSQV